MKVAWAFVLKSKDYGFEYEKEFPPCPAPTNLKTYRGFEALKCLHKAHMPGNLRYCKTTNKSCPRGVTHGQADFSIQNGLIVGLRGRRTRIIGSIYRAGACRGNTVRELLWLDEFSLYCA